MERTSIATGVFGNFIENRRFKKSIIAVSFFADTDVKTAAENEILINILAAACPSYPDFTAMNRRLDSLYGASVRGRTIKTGDSFQTSLMMAVADDRFSAEGNLESASELLLKLIFERKGALNPFSEEELKREKRLAIIDILSDESDKRKFSLSRLLSEMCQGEGYGISRSEIKAEIEKLTVSDIERAYRRLLTTARTEILFIGASLPEEFFESYRFNFAFIPRHYEPLSENTVKNAEKTKTVTEKQAVAQGKLCLGLRTSIHGSISDTAALRIGVDLFGGNVYSRLFTVVREKMSLCYYCAARLVRSKGIVTVESGVEKANTEKAKAAILAELQYMKDGKFCEDDINNSKRALCDAHRAIESDILVLAGFYLSQLNEGKLLSPSEVIKALEGVTKEEIIEAINTVSLDTIFVLEPEEK